MQRKLTRKPKSYVRPSAIIQFQDYSRAMTPLDRYRKHYVMFDYWNSELLGALEGRDFNVKRLRTYSSEALQELRQLQALLQDDRAAQVEPLIAQRATVDQQINQRPLMPSDLGAIRQRLEGQTRRIHRELSWRVVEDHVKGQETTDAVPH